VEQVAGLRVIVVDDSLLHSAQNANELGSILAHTFFANSKSNECSTFHRFSAE
jgi:hypothetical protein